MRKPEEKENPSDNKRNLNNNESEPEKSTNKDMEQFTCAPNPINYTDYKLINHISTIKHNRNNQRNNQCQWYTIGKCADVFWHMTCRCAKMSHWYTIGKCVDVFSQMMCRCAKMSDCRWQYTRSRSCSRPISSQWWVQDSEKHVESVF